MTERTTALQRTVYVSDADRYEAIKDRLGLTHAETMKMLLDVYEQQEQEATK